MATGHHQCDCSSRQTQAKRTLHVKVIQLSHTDQISYTSEAKTSNREESIKSKNDGKKGYVGFGTVKTTNRKSNKKSQKDEKKEHTKFGMVAIKARKPLYWIV
jgi:hypothetical protein